nr:hypothetical protein [Tanacetum cinerariifolium]
TNTPIRYDDGGGGSCGCGDGIQWWKGDGGDVAVAVAATCGCCSGVWRRCSGGRGRREEWRRVVASDIWDRIDRVTGSIFGFSGNARRKSFPATAGGSRKWWWLAGGGEVEEECVFYLFFVK